MSNFSQFFLNSSSRVVLLELVDIFHPNFTKRYRIVRNAINGVTVTLEDLSVATFDYYPLKITPTGSNNDLDQVLQVQFGDLGSILPMELDRVIVKPVSSPNHGCCIGAFADAAGNLVAPPFFVGLGINIFVPQDAAYLQIGANDNGYGDNGGGWNIFIDGALAMVTAAVHAPWDYIVGVKNTKYPYTQSGTSGSPDRAAVTPGTLIQITVTGLIALHLPGPINLDGNGDPLNNPAPAGCPSYDIPRDPPPGTYIKPTLLYRTYRSDDLSQPLDGPHRFQVDNIAFQKEGATMQCTAARLNLSATGEIYTMDRFPMLRGFL